MRISKINKRLACVLSFAILGFLGSGKVEAASKDDKFLFEAPTIGALVNDYEEQAKVSTKIDGVKYYSYLKVINSKGYISNYSNKDVWGLRLSTTGVMHYAPNLISSANLTYQDRVNGVRRMIKTGTYIENKADIYWNYAVRYSKDAATKDANYFGSFDTLKNFKPGYEDIGTHKLMPQWPKYPIQEGSKIAGTEEAEGSHYFYVDTVDNPSSIHASKVSWRSDAVKKAIGTKQVVKGEWRILGSNVWGNEISNASFPKDQGASSNKARDYKKKWAVSNPTGIYNQSTSEENKLIRENTWKRLSETIDLGSYAPKSKYNDIFTIGAPASEHLTGSLRGYYGDYGNPTRDYMTVIVPANYTLDLSLNRMEIKDGDKTLYKMEQKTTSTGVGGQKQTTTQNVKLQPGYTYTVEMEIENLSNKTVYNPTFNILGATGEDLTSQGNNLVDSPSSSSSYWVYTNTTLQEGKDFGQDEYTDKGYFSVNGERLKKDSKTGQKIVPSLDSGSIKPREKKVIKVDFKVPAPNKDGIYNAFDVTNPNNVRLRFAGQINSKHSIADEVFVWGGIDNDKVKNSADNLYTTNDVLSMNKAFYTQDMAIGTNKEIKVTDAKGNEVTNNEFIKGEEYKVGIKVKNPSGIWGTTNKPKINYSIKDSKTEEVLKSGTAQAKRTLAKEDSEYVYFSVKIPMNASNQVQISAELNEIHQKSQEDWYMDNNKFEKTFKAKSPVDLQIMEAMGDVIGDESSPSTVEIFAGETVGLKVYVQSPETNYVVKPVEVEFSYKNNGKNISATKNIGAIDKNNPQTIVYPYTAPNKAGTYEVTAHLNPKGSIDEIDTSNNKHVFKVVVKDDLEKYATTTHIEGKKPDGSEQGNSNITVAKEYSSYTPSVIIQRRDPVYSYNEDTDEYIKTWGDWYDYTVEFRDKPLYVQSTETLEIVEARFKSKFTTDRRTEGKDTDIIDSKGFVNLVGGVTESEKERIQALGKIKAGYGFELEIKTKYKNDVLSKYNDAISKGMNTKIGASTLTSITNSKIKELEKEVPDSEFRITSKVKFSPSPLETIINAKDQVLSLTMPNGKVYKSTDGILIEKISGGTASQSQAYDTGAVWSYRFKERKNGIQGESRKYYLGNNVRNGDYYIRIGTSKLGVGGLLDLEDGYEGNGKPTRVYAAKDIKINVYGGREDDLKDNE